MNVDPDARGISPRAWLMQEISRQAEAYRQTLHPEEAPLNRKAISTSPDNYGWRSGRDNRNWYDRHGS